MRFMHLADLHIGKVLNGFSLIEDQRFALAQLMDYAAAQKLDAIVLAGDLYDKAAPSAEAVALLDELLTRIAATGIPCLAIPGNHDSADRVGYASGLLAHEGIHVPARYDGAVAHVELADEYGPVVFWLLPFLKPAQVRPYFPDDDIGSDYTAALASALSACDVDPAKRNVLVAHQNVSYAGRGPIRSDSEFSVGGLDNVDATAFDAFDYVALGHIHRPQRIGRDTVRYAGSLLKYSLSEIRYPKSACIVTLGPKGQCSVDLHPITPLHDLREISGPLNKLCDDDVVAGQDADDYLSVVLTDEEPRIDALGRLRARYPNVLSVTYASERERTAEAPAASEDGTSDDLALNPLALFERFFEQQTGAALSEDQRAIARAELERACEQDFSDEGRRA